MGTTDVSRLPAQDRLTANERLPAKERLPAQEGLTAQERLTGALIDAGHRLTEPRRQVAGLVAAHTGHFTAADLVADAARLRPQIGRATIFRALELFTELGVVERLDLPAGDHAYVRCDPVHHHHVVCASCGRSVEVDDSGVAAVTADIARRTGYRIEAHRLELYGICPACAGAGR
ncbi:MAG TPA: Fur family transcriptional regulator [Candidatus Limnocylindrales bacterium]